MPEAKKVTEEEAAQALQQLTQQADESEPTENVQVETEAEQPAEDIAPAETAAEETDEAAATEETDDVASLKKRLEEHQAQAAEEKKQFEARWKALQHRQAQNEQILRERYLKKATVTDRALKFMKAAKTEQGVPPDEWDRAIQEIEGTMNPASASYAPPVVQEGVEDQALVLNSFLNERGMTGEEAEEFGKWMRSEGATKLSPMEQAVASQSLDGFLRLAHGRWQEGLSEKDKNARQTDAVNAVKSVQRTQKEAAKAASASPASPRKPPASPSKEIDVKKLTKEDVSALLRQSVEQYR